MFPAELPTIQMKKRLWPGDPKDCLDHKRFADTLKKIGYAGDYCIIEIFRPEYYELSQEENVKKSAEVTKAHVEKYWADLPEDSPGGSRFRGAFRRIMKWRCSMLDKNKVSLGIAPIGWTNDDMPDLGKEIPLSRPSARWLWPASKEPRWEAIIPQIRQC